MEFFRQITFWMNDLFLYYLALGFICLFLSFLLKVFFLHRFEHHQKYSTPISREESFPISILVPTHNQKEAILETLVSLLRLHYPHYEIIVIDDGSTDDTLERLIQKYHFQKTRKVYRRKLPVERIKDIYETVIGSVHLTLIAKDHGGRADALNAGINVATYPFFVTVDSGSILEKDALNHLIRPVLEEPNLIAAGGMIRISDKIKIKNGEVVECYTPKKMTAVVQCLEYYRVRLSSKMLLDEVNGNLFLSGSFALFKKEMVINCGGYSTSLIDGELELFLRLHEYCLKNKLDYKMKSVPEAICHMQITSDSKELKIQRKNWYLGLLQSLKAHFSICCQLKYGIVGFVSFFNYWICEFGSCLIETIGLLSLLLSFAMGGSLEANLLCFITYGLFSTAFALNTYFTRIHQKVDQISWKEEFRVIFYTWIGGFLFRPFLNLERVGILFSDQKVNSSKRYVRCLERLKKQI